MRRNNEFFLKRTQKAVHDEHLVRREFYNPNNFSILFELMPDKIRYVKGSGIPTGPKSAILKPDDFLVLPHAYFILRAMNGAPFFDLIQNYGDQIGIGNKKPSRPEIKTR